MLVPCVKEKLKHRAKAEDLYVSPLFRLSLAYARQLAPSLIFVLSAKYGLVALTQEIDPYDVTLNEMPSHAVKEWAEAVLAQLRLQADTANDHFVFLAGARYRRYLIPHLRSHAVPLQGLRLGEQLQYLKGRLDG